MIEPHPRIRVSAILRWADRILLIRHEKGGRDNWLLPGGGVKSGESIIDALQRELSEEIGLFGVEDELPVEGPVAIVDSGYRGELRVILLNTDREAPFTVEPGMRIAQLVVLPVPGVELVEVDELPESERGVRGFGSSQA